MATLLLTFRADRSKMALQMQKFLLSFLFCFSIVFIGFPGAPAAAEQPADYNSTIENALDSVEKEITPQEDSLVTNSVFPTDQPTDQTKSHSDIIDVFDVNDMDIHDALKLISELSGLSITTKDEIAGNLTIYLKNINVHDALKIILDINDLAYTEDNGHILVMTAKDFESEKGYSFGQSIQAKMVTLLNLKVIDVIENLNQMKSLTGKVIYNDRNTVIILMDVPEKVKAMEAWIKEVDAPLSTEIFNLKNIKGSDVVSNIQAILTKNIGHLQFDERSNNIVVTDTQVKIKEVDKLIKSLDQDNKEIIIQAKILQIVLNEEHQQGIDWEAIVANFQSSEFAGFDHNNKSSDHHLSCGIVSEEDYKVLLGALDTVGVSNIVSDSQMTVSVNEPLEVVVKSIDLSMTPEDRQKSDTTKDERVKFLLRPTINFDNTFTLKIKPRLVSNDPNPGIKVNDIIMKIPEGSTVAMGGLFKEIVVESTRKIPLLGDLPFVGFAFRNQGQRLIKTEIVVFLTPKVILKEKAPAPLTGFENATK